MSFYRAHGIQYYWIVGTALSCSVLVVGLAYIVAEYCTQSHLATENFGDACEGMKLTRRFKKYTYWIRILLGLWDKVLLLFWKLICFPWQRTTGRQSTPFNKTLIWDWKVKPEQALEDQSRRWSGTQPLMGGLQDQGFFDDNRTLERSESERPENNTHDSQQHDTQDWTNLQIPTQMHPTYAYSQPPSSSSEASLSTGPLSQ